jgi:HEAT repeat protein
MKIEGVRRKAADALGWIKEPAVGPLIETLKDKNENVRYEATMALGEIGDVRAKEPLMRALRDKDRWVRDSALVALEKIRKRERMEMMALDYRLRRLGK